MIDVKQIAKPRQRGNSGANSKGGGYGVSGKIAEEAKRAAKADLATHAEQAEYADRAGMATRAAYANNISNGSSDWQKIKALIEEIGADKFLSRLNPDTANELITFAKGLLFGNNKGIDEAGNATLESVIASVLQSVNFAATEESGFAVNKRKDGRYQLLISDIIVWGKAVFNELEIRRFSHVGGNVVSSAAGSKIKSVTTLQQGSVSVYRCYLHTDDGTTQTSNLWQVGDLARCEVFNLAGKKKHQYWRLVTSVGNDYIDLSSVEASAGSDAPQAGDTIVQMGNKTKTDRQSLIQILTVGDEAPAIVWYDRVNTFSLEGKRTAIVSPKKTAFMAALFELISDNGSSELLSNVITQIRQSIGRIETQVATNKRTTDGAIEEAKSLIVQTADSLRLEVSSKTLNGSNLFDNATFNEELKTAYNNGGGSVTMYIGNDAKLALAGQKYLYIKSVGNTSSTYAGFRTKTKVESGKTYTASVYCAPAFISTFKDGDSIRLEIKALRAGNIIERLDKNVVALVQSKVWTRHVETFQVPTDCDTIEMNVWLSKNGEAMVTMPQLEMGSVATTWSPNAKEFERRLTRTGIDIEQGVITLQAGKVRLIDAERKEVAFIDDKGHITASSLSAIGENGVYSYIAGGEFQIGLKVGEAKKPYFDIAYNENKEVVMRYLDENGNVVGVIDKTLFALSSVADTWKPTEPIKYVGNTPPTVANAPSVGASGYSVYYEFSCGYARPNAQTKIYNHTKGETSPEFNGKTFIKQMSPTATAAEMSAAAAHIADGYYISQKITEVIVPNDNPLISDDTRRARTRAYYLFQDGRLVDITLLDLDKR